MDSEEKKEFQPIDVGDFRRDMLHSLEQGKVHLEIQKYVKKLGPSALRDEILGMSYKDMGDVALAAADAIGESDLARQMARLVRNHAGYDLKRVELLLEKYSE